ncbi:MAG: site-specific integrase [Propionibacteriaceae bacterium]|jgi:integrase|nr:site-specific integrase [Propionibacteriaceae bacterium]
MGRPKGSGSVYERSDGGWVACVELPSGPAGERRRRYVQRSTKAEANQALKTMLRNLTFYGDSSTRNPTLREWMDSHLVILSQRLKPGVLADYESLTRNWIIPVLGGKRVGALTATDVRRLTAACVTAGHPTTAARAHAVLSGALKRAEQEGIAMRNVARLAPPPRHAPTVRTALTTEQARSLLLTVANLPDRAATDAAILLTGLRQGERLGLTREQIDWRKGVLTVNWSLQRVSWRHGCQPRCDRVRGTDCPDRVGPDATGHETRHVQGGLWLLRPKSRAGWRQIPICPPLEAVLRPWVETTPEGPEGLVFTTGDGAPVDPRADSDAWHADLEAAGLPSVPIHSGRHTTATLLHDLGIDEQTRMDILGHSEATVTRGYTHVTSETAHAAMRRLGELVAN